MIFQWLTYVFIADYLCPSKPVSSSILFLSHTVFLSSVLEAHTPAFSTSFPQVFALDIKATNVIYIGLNALEFSFSNFLKFISAVCFLSVLLLSFERS